MHFGCGLARRATESGLQLIKSRLRSVHSPHPLLVTADKPTRLPGHVGMW